MRGSTTYLPNAEGRFNSATSAVAPSAAPAEEEADGGGDALDATTMATLTTRGDGLNVIVDSGLDAIETSLAPARKRSRSAVTPDDLTATVAPQPALPLLPPPPPPPSRTGAIDLRATPTYAKANDGKMHRVVAIAHERAWVAGNPESIRGNVASGPTYNHQWYHIGPTGERIGPGDREFEDMSVLESFLHMMPPKQLQHIFQLTNVRLVASDRQQLTRQELLRFIGVCTLISTINFRGARRNLWEGGNTISEFLPTINLKGTGMTRNRFEDIWSAIRWSDQPPAQPEGMSSERYRWMLVDDFIANFNEHRQRTFVPGSHLEVDESIIRWYGMGGGYISAGLPMYVDLDRKPDSGGEIQNIADVESGIMLRLKIVKSATENKAIATEDLAAAAADGDDDEMDESGGKGTKVLLELTEPWHNTGRLVGGDAYFASVEAAVAMKDKGMLFIGNVKQCHKKFPMAFLSNTILCQRGSRSVLASISEETGETELVAISWVDRNRRFFIATAFGLGEGETIQRKRMRQLNKDGRSPPDRVLIEVRQPKAVEMYYKGAGTIDLHNRIRAAELRMDTNLRTRDWAKRFNFGILGMVCVDAFLFYQKVVHADNRKNSCLEFFGQLADELIKNNEGVRQTRAAVENQAAETAAAAAPPRLRWTERTKKRTDGTKGVSQGRCGDKDCKRYTSHVCSACTIDSGPRPYQRWFCNHTTRSGSDCFAKHVREVHGGED